MSNELTQVSDPNAVTYVRSQITTVVSHQAGEDAETVVTHRTQFDLEPSTVADIVTGAQPFRPTRMVVTWINGDLDEVRFSGPRVLKNGLSTKEFRDKRVWKEWNNGSRSPIDLSQYGEAVEKTVNAYDNANVVKGVPA